MKDRLCRLISGLAVMLLWALTGCAAHEYPPLLDRSEAYSPPSESQKSWALATCAVLTESNGRRHDMLGGCERSPKEARAWQESLAKWWNTRNREELLQTLEWIEDGGHRRQFDAMARELSAASPEQLERIRQQVANDPSASNKVEIVLRYKDKYGAKSITGWDFSRYVSLCGWGYIAGYLTEDEAWGRIMPAARLLQKTFTSWEDLGMNHVVGREFWSLKQTKVNGARTRQCFEKLKADPASPWRCLDWNMSLASPETAKTQSRPPSGTR